MMYAELGEDAPAPLDEEDAMSRLTPHFKKRIEDALEPLLGPLASVLQSRGAEERKRREKFLALEEKKLALRRMKLQLKRRRAGRFQPTRRASSAKLWRLRRRPGLCLKSPPP